MFNDATIVKRGNTVIVQHGDDSSTFARFYRDQPLNKERSEKEGRPCFDNIEMCEITFAGDNTKVKIGRATDGNPPYYLRYAKQYEIFKREEFVPHEGTPIEHWPPITRALALELKAMNIHTVEMLASVPDVNLKWMGARQLRENAKVWLSEAEAGKEAIRLNNKIEELQMQIEAMKNQNSGFSASQKQEEVVQSQSIAPPSLEAPDIKPIVTKMRGRPKKVENGANITPTDATGSE
jgi:hypothetical protein